MWKNSISNKCGNLRIFHKEYLKVNSLGTIPCLIDGDTKLTESCAIPTYLLQKYRKGSSLEILPTESDYGSYLNFIAHADATLTFPLTVYLRYSKFETKKGLSQAGEVLHVPTFLLGSVHKSHDPKISIDFLLTNQTVC